MESRQLNARTASERADEVDEKETWKRGVVMIVVANFGAVDGVLVARLFLSHPTVATQYKNHPFYAHSTTLSSFFVISLSRSALNISLCLF